MLYRVHFEQTLTAEVIVEADSYEQAVQRAAARPPVKTADRMRPDWVGTDAYVETEGEYEYEVIGRCTGCKQSIVDRAISGQPWTHTSNDHGAMYCYPCGKDIPT